MTQKITNPNSLILDEVKNRSYPAPEHTYPITAQELKDFEAIVEQRRGEFEEE